MPNIDTMKTSNYLKKEDVGSGVLVTINRMEPKIVKEDGEEKKIWVIYFNEFQKPLWSNATHREQIANYLNSRVSEDWTNKQVVLWNDLSAVHFGKVGAIRVRAAVNQSAAQPVQPTQPNNFNQAPPQQDFNQTPPDFNDDIPGFD